MTINVRRARLLEAQYEALASVPASGETLEEQLDSIECFQIAWSIIRGLHDYSIIDVPGVNYFDGERSITYSPGHRQIDRKCK